MVTDARCGFGDERNQRPFPLLKRVARVSFLRMKKFRTGLMVAALATLMGTNTTFAQDAGQNRQGGQGAGASSDMGGATQTEERTSKAPLLGLLGLLGLMGLKRRHEVHNVDRR